ncbi:MAG: WYL domain-containing protein [Peptococcaceae bacterium]|nr:WYL domain-containing protein [Peptococcaceae bacterium]
MRVQRLMAIILLLESRGKVRAQDLAAVLETSERTIYRDVEDLCAAGVPIVAQSGPHGGLSLAESYSLKPEGLDTEDIINLYMCGISIRPQAQSAVNINLKSTLAMLEQALPLAYRADVEKAQKSFFFDPTPSWRTAPEIAHMDRLRKAVWNTLKIRVQYINGSYSTNSTILPYGLVVKHTDWYVVGHCHMRQTVRALRCDRIRNVTVLEESFTVPPSFDLEVFWQKWMRESANSIDRV